MADAQIFEVGATLALVSKSSNHSRQGGTTAQAVSRRLPTAAARVRSQVRSCGICGRQSGTGVGFLLVLRFPLPILIAPNYSTLIYHPGLVQ
jgi:hypothetical protein